MDCNAYVFIIALKPLTVRGERVSNTIKRKIMRVSDFDSQTQTYTMSAYLIAQLGKNYTDGRNKEITGAELLELAWSVIEDMQYMGGGKVVFLEANDEEICICHILFSFLFSTKNTALNIYKTVYPIQ